MPFNFQTTLVPTGPKLGAPSSIEAGYGPEQWNAALHQMDQDRNLAGQQQAGENYRAKLAADASLYPHQLRQQRFNALLPMLSKEMGGAGQFGYGVGGSQVGQQPIIGGGRVYSDDQIQQQVNAMRAQNDTATAGRIHAAQESLGGRGFGGNSPLLQALAGQQQAANLAANTQGEMQLRLGAAKENAESTLAAQQAQEGQFANRQNEDIKRRQQFLGYRQGLLGLLAGMA